MQVGRVDGKKACAGADAAPTTGLSTATVKVVSVGAAVAPEFAAPLVTAAVDGVALDGTACWLAVEVAPAVVLGIVFAEEAIAICDDGNEVEFGFTATLRRYLHQRHHSASSSADPRAWERTTVNLLHDTDILGTRSIHNSHLQHSNEGLLRFVIRLGLFGVECALRDLENVVQTLQVIRLLPRFADHTCAISMIEPTDVENVDHVGAGR